MNIHHTEKEIETWIQHLVTDDCPESMTIEYKRKQSFNSELGRNVSNWLNRKEVYPHNVLVFENEHCIEPTSVIYFTSECSFRNHSAAFPIELLSWFIRLFTRKDDIVLDPFVGVGTAAIAATLLERIYIGMYQQLGVTPPIG